MFWFEFSWKIELDKEDGKCCYWMFVFDIFRLGYINEGRIYFIICL